MGCALSHLALWEKLAKDNLAKRYLIMEDDVKFHENWLAHWYPMVPHIPEEADVIYLGGILPPNKEAFQHVVDRVNPFFAKVAKNTLTTPYPRRYFHFCNYSYILTQSGARKLVQLVKERGIFTSGDHMIVNHGDDF
jgi:GR25 family glycosyltransferase involved in LPS biosynthesis